MATFTRSVVGYLATFPQQAGLRIEQVKALRAQQRGLTPGRIRQALAGAGHASPDQRWLTLADLRESAQADSYLTKV
jgi:hypothetical protein